MATKYSLSIDDINPTVKNFFLDRPDCVYEIQDSQDGRKRVIKIHQNGKTGLVNLFFSNGQVSYNIQGSPDLNSLCKDCWSKIEEETKLVVNDHKTFSLKNVDPERFDGLIAWLRTSEDINVVVAENHKRDSIRSLIHLKGPYGATLTLSYFNNATLLIQGKVSSFFIDIMNLSLSLMADIDEEDIKELFDVKNTVGCVFDLDLHSHFSDLTHIEGSIISDFILTTLVLMNSGVVVPDYGCHTFCILKAVEGLLRSRILEDVPDFDNFGDYFVLKKNGCWDFKDNCAIFDNNQRLKSCLCRAYSLLNMHRHTTFHVDRANIEVSRVLTYDEALNITKEAIVVINDLCKFW